MSRPDPRSNLKHLPKYLFLGTDRGVTRYTGQPPACYQCGGYDHIRQHCSSPLCAQCGEKGHGPMHCPTGVVCNLCRTSGHTYLLCQQAYYNKTHPGAYEKLRASHLFQSESGTGRSGDSFDSFSSGSRLAGERDSMGGGKSTPGEQDQGWMLVQAAKKKAARGRVQEGVYRLALKEAVRGPMSNKFGPLKHSGRDPEEEMEVAEQEGEASSLAENRREEGGGQGGGMGTKEKNDKRKEQRKKTTKETRKPDLRTIDDMTMEELTQELSKARAEMDRVRDERKELGDDPDSLASRPVGDPKNPAHAMKVRLQNRQLSYRDKITVISCAMDHLKDTEQERPGDQEMEVGEGGEEASTGEGTQEGPGRDPPNESEVHSGIPPNQEQYRQER
ncbi:UNVERIFIED_CONTAM: hypothetical protein K2H54_002080 [Gekko kuhli]